MKLKDMIAELQKVEVLNPNQDVQLYSVRHNGGTYTYTSVEFADVSIVHNQNVIRIANSADVEDVRKHVQD